MKSVKLHSAYKPLFTSKKRYFLVTGGRGSLKSTTVHDFVARLTYERGHGILFTRYTMKSAELSIIPEFLETLERLDILDDFYITKTRIINKRTKSFIYFSGIKVNSKDQTGNLKSIAGITTWVIEEGEDFKDEKAFDTIDDSIRSSVHQNRIIWIQNPTTRQHFIYKRWIEPNNKQINVKGFNVTVSNDPQVEHIHTTYHIAEKMGYLASGWLTKANKAKKAFETKVNQTKLSWTKTKTELENEIRVIKHTSHYYYNYIGGWLERAEGVIFSNWIEGKFDTSLPYCFGQDYGYSPDPFATVKIAVDKKAMKIYIKEYIYETELDEITAKYESVGISKRDLIITDTNEPRTTKAIKKEGYNIKPVSKTQSNGKESGISQDIRVINKYTLIVDPESTNVKTELNNYTWNDKKASIPIDDFNHAMDGMRYGVNKLIKPKRKGLKRRN